MAVTVIVAPPEPETGETLSQVALSDMLHGQFELILNVPVDPETQLIEILDGDVVKVRGY